MTQMTTKHGKVTLRIIQILNFYTLFNNPDFEKQNIFRIHFLSYVEYLQMFDTIVYLT